MRVLLGTIVVGPSKDYAVPKFEEMCRDLLPDVDVVAVVDHPNRTTLPVIPYPSGASLWATEIVYHAKDSLRDYALFHDYDALIWQGIDCYYNSRHDFDLLVAGARDHAIIGGLVAGRNRPDYAVCRHFIGDTMEQFDHLEGKWPNAWNGVRSIPGYIGSDATLIRRDALEMVTMDGYQHWHQIKDTCTLTSGALGPEEYFMWSAINRHRIIPALEARCRPWHAHESGLCARYPNETRDLAMLGWGDSRKSDAQPDPGLLERRGAGR